MYMCFGTLATATASLYFFFFSLQLRAVNLSTEWQRWSEWTRLTPPGSQETSSHRHMHHVTTIAVRNEHNMARRDSFGAHVFPFTAQHAPCFRPCGGANPHKLSATDRLPAPDAPVPYKALDPTLKETGSIYPLCISAIVPRPIALVSSVRPPPSPSTSLRVSESSRRPRCANSYRPTAPRTSPHFHTSTCSPTIPQQSRLGSVADPTSPPEATRRIHMQISRRPRSLW